MSAYFRKEYIKTKVFDAELSCIISDVFQVRSDSDYDDSLLDSCMISELIEGVLEVCGDSVKQIILYGSVARHEETDESDIDIALILNQELNGETRTQFINLLNGLLSWI